MTVGVKQGNIRKLSISISNGSADWIDEKLKGYKYRNISHAIESLIREKMESEAK